MARETDLPFFMPPGMPWFAVAIAGMFAFMARSPAPVAAIPTPAAGGTALAAEANEPAPADDADWQENMSGTAKLFWRFLGDVPPGPPAQDSKSVLSLPLVEQLDTLKAHDTRQSKARRTEADEQLRRLKAKLTERADVRVLVATVADYHDSNGRWRADEELVTIQAAAGAAGYSLLDFYLPDWQAGAAAVQAETLRRHEREPGALLFRKDPDSAAIPARPKPALLLVLLVPETPTAGVHVRVLETAVRFARNWWPTRSVEVVGPKFSGSTLSVRTALEEIAADGGGRLSAVIVSGLASSSSNKRLLLEATPRSRGALSIDYRTTVHYDEDLLLALHEQLKRINPKWESGNHVALLVEANTGWGTKLTSTAAGLDSRTCGTRAPLGIASFPCATVLSFPLHVSRLAGATETGHARSSSTSSLPQWAQGLQGSGPGLGDTVTPTDALPVFTPNTTATVAGAMLHDVLESLSRGGYGAVGIFATDVRDHLFLAREINRVAPNVLRFGVDPHMLMLHPDYQPYVRGTLMASSYPTHARVQRLTSATGQTSAKQFASMGAQGMYNAVLSLLTPWEPREGANGEQVPLLDYSGPWIPGGARPSAGPVPWVVVVGREGFSPLAVGRTVHTTSLAAVSRADPPTPPRTYLLESWQAGSLWALAPLLLAAYLVALFASQRRRIPGFHLFEPHEDRPRGQRLEHAMLTLGCALPLAMALAWQLRVWETLSLELSEAQWLPLLFRVGFAGVLLFAAEVGIGLAVTAGLRIREARRRTRWPWPEVTSLGAVVLALVMGFYFCIYLTDGTIWAGASAVFHVERTMAVSSLISPAPAIVALLGLGFGWSYWGLRSLHHHVVNTRRKPTLMRLLEGKKDDPSGGLALGAGSTVHPAGKLAWLPWIAVGGAFLLVVPQTNAIDGAALGSMLTVGSMLGLVAISIELGQASWLGHRTKDALEHLRGHALGPIIEDLGNEQGDWGMSLEPRHGKTRRLLRDKLEGLQRRLKGFRQELGETHVVLVDIPNPDRRRPGGMPAAEGWQMATARRVEIRASDISALAHKLSVEPPCPLDGVLDAPPDQALVRTQLWKTSVSVAEQLATPLEHRFWCVRYPIPAYTVPGRFLKDAERFVAIVMAVLVRTMVVRVVRGLSIAALLGATLLFAHLMYTFPGRRFWLVLDLLALTLVAVVSVRQLLVFERDHILNRLWSSQPGRVGFNSGLLWRAMATSALPLLTLLAVLFPEVGGGLMTWIEPLRHLMPVP